MRSSSLLLSTVSALGRETGVLATVSENMALLPRSILPTIRRGLANASDENAPSTSSEQPSTPSAQLDADTLRSFLAASREHRRKREAYEQQFEVYDRERRDRINAWRVEFMMRKEADAKKKAAEEIERATLRAEAKARVREAKSSPEILAAKRALEEQRKKDQERRAATRVIRYYAIRSVRERFDEAYAAYLRGQATRWVAESELEARVERALENPVPLWGEEDQQLRASNARKPKDVIKEEKGK